jgi:hypothetical protein
MSSKLKYLFTCFLKCFLGGSMEKRYSVPSDIPLSWILACTNVPELYSTLSIVSAACAHKSSASSGESDAGVLE